MKIKSENGWAIAGDYGIYTGWWLTRTDAIEAHKKALGKTWETCKRHGDKAIRITIKPRPNA